MYPQSPYTTRDAGHIYNPLNVQSPQVSQSKEMSFGNVKSDINRAQSRRFNEKSQHSQKSSPQVMLSRPDWFKQHSQIPPPSSYSSDPIMSSYSTGQVEAPISLQDGHVFTSHTNHLPHTYPTVGATNYIPEQNKLHHVRAGGDHDSLINCNRVDTGSYLSVNNHIERSHHGSAGMYVSEDTFGYLHCDSTEPKRATCVPNFFENSFLQKVIPKELHFSSRLKQIKYAAKAYIYQVCPDLGRKPFCFPPVNRFKNPNKANKHLVILAEAERRVLGSFERYFVDNNLPVFMLCHYPAGGFLRNTSYVDNCRSENLQLPKQETITLLLLSEKISVTIVTVSIVSGNSEYAYILKAVKMAALNMRKQVSIVTEWLHTLGIHTKVKELLAFPNLKKSSLRRIFTEKAFQHQFETVTALNADQLSAQFEDEMTTAVHKVQFSHWMDEEVMVNNEVTLKEDDLHVLVGTLLCPGLSQVEYTEHLEMIKPTPASVPQVEAENETVDVNVSELQLTIDGVTQSFDEFMDNYVNNYYPNVDTQTYRVPPIHFNIQSFRSPEDVLNEIGNPDKVDSFKREVQEFEGATDVSDQSGSEEETLTHCRQLDSNIQEEECRLFMPRNRPVMISACSTFGCKECMNKSRQKIKKSFCLNDSSLLKSGPEEESPEKNCLIIDTQAPQCNSVPSNKDMFSSSKASVGEYPSLSKSANDQIKSLRHRTLQGVEILAPVMIKDVRADEGENRVISAFELLGHREGPMFIICAYQYNNYLNKLREEMFTKGETGRPIRAFGQTMRAEHDCLLVHKDLGIIVVCIKAIGDNFKTWGASEDTQNATVIKVLSKAFKQLDREEAMVRHVTSDLNPIPPCHKVIAVPNLTKAAITKALVLDEGLKQKLDTLSCGLGVEYLLCQDELPEKFRSIWDPPDPGVVTSLQQWWARVQKLWTSAPDAKLGMNTNTYRQVIGRYCGLLSTVEVWTPTNPRIEVRSVSEGISQCAARFAKFVLLPEQLKILVSLENRVYLYGPPGSGKTLLLLLKAKEWLLDGRKVVLINAREYKNTGYPFAYGLERKLRKMVPHGHLERIDIDSMSFSSYSLAHVLPSQCVIMDEVSGSSHDIIEHLCSLQVHAIWCAGLFEDHKPVTAKGFTSFRLDKILRCPPIVQSLLRHTEKNVRPAKPYEKEYERSVLESNSDYSTTTNAKFIHLKGRYENKTCVVTKRENRQDIESQTQPSEIQTSNKIEVSNSYDDSFERRISQKFGKKYVKANKNFLSQSRCKMESCNVEKTYNLEYHAEIKDEHSNCYDDTFEQRISQKFGKQPVKDNKNSKSKEPSEITSSQKGYIRSSTLLGLPTDGPRPHIIDHQRHSSARLPTNCQECGLELAKFLKSMVKSDKLNHKHRQNNFSKNKFVFKSSNFNVQSKRGLRSVSPDVSSVNNATSSGQKLQTFSDSKALMWSDVLIASRIIERNSVLLQTLQRSDIPVEVVKGDMTSKIEDPSENKLFATLFKEVTGLERSLIVFVPSEAKDELRPGSDDESEDERMPDLLLGSSIARFTREDKHALWYIASRSLSSLVLILP